MHPPCAPAYTPLAAVRVRKGWLASASSCKAATRPLHRPARLQLGLCIVLQGCNSASASSCKAATQPLGSRWATRSTVHLQYLELTVSFVTDRAPASNCMPTTPRPTRWPPLIKLSKDRTMFRVPLLARKSVETPAHPQKISLYDF